MQAKLKAAIEAFAGDKADEVAFFEATIAPLAAELGLPFSYEEGKSYSQGGVELSDDELEAVVGGSICYFAGGGGEPDAQNCYGNDNEKGTGACSFAGVSLFVWD